MGSVPPATPPPTPAPTPSPTTLPQLPAPDFLQPHRGISLLGGWFPLTIEVISVVALIAVIGWRTRRWRLVWLPASAAVGVLGALAVRTYMNTEGLASDPAPFRLWIWVALFAGALAVVVLGWRRAPWWRRGLTVLVVPCTLLSVLLTLNQWIGYYPTVQAAWGAVTAGPLPNQVDAAALPGLRNTSPSTGKLVEVDIPDDASGFIHRSEYVYLPPAWFAGSTPPPLPVIMMIAGEFNTPADWMRSGNAMPIIDAYARSHNGQAPIFVFVDAGGRFNNDTECVNGPRGNAADHVTKDVRPFVISHYGASAAPSNWGVIGWSMGGTCAIDLTVIHPDLFSSFEDIGGDHGPTAGTQEQTINRLYGGNAALWDAFDPTTVMARHGPYTGVAGWFEDTVDPPDADAIFRSLPPPPPQPVGPLGYGGHEDWDNNDQSGAPEDLCRAATAVTISCSVHKIISFHTWQFAARAFSDALPWMAAELHTPTAGSPA
jgi:S-formylglutathione hydrolase FrmB